MPELFAMLCKGGERGYGYCSIMPAVQSDGRGERGYRIIMPAMQSDGRGEGVLQHHASSAE